MTDLRNELLTRHFESEAEEAAWWDNHQNDLADEFEKAAVTGTLGSGTAARRGSTPDTTPRP